MDISQKKLVELEQVAQKVANGSELKEVTIIYLEKGEEKSVTIDHPILLQLMKLSLLMVHNKRGS